MKADAQRIAIAEACGRKGPFTSDPTKEGVFVGGLPDYLNDLNAMHEAERILLFGRLGWVHYSHRLLGNNIHATAAQRAAALLHTLGKWEDSA